MPMRIYPAPHYTMGGLWVDYNLMTTIDGLYAIGEANFSDHGANRLGASALMQGLADGYFVLPVTIGDYLAPQLGKPDPTTENPAFAAVEAEVRDGRGSGCWRSSGTHTVDWFHRELGRIVWDNCGMARNAAGLERAIERDPRAARGVLARRARAGQRRGPQPGAREGRPRGRLLRAGRADVPRRAAPRGVLRRALPRGAPDARPRGAAPRRPVRLRRGVGVDGRRRAGLHEEDLEFQYVQPSQRRTSEADAADLAPGRAGRARARSRPTRSTDASPDMSFLELLDELNERLTEQGIEPIAFESDCREGICGTCGLMINGTAHGPRRGTATCQLYVREFTDGEMVTVEPWRSRRVPADQGPRSGPGGVRRDHPGGRLHHRAHRLGAGREPRCRCPRRPPTWRWTPRRASAAARASRRAPTAPASSSPPPSSRT